MSEYEERTENDSQSLVDQLGTDPKRLARGLVDNIKLTYLVGSEKIPDQFKPAWFLLTQKLVVSEDKSYEDAVVESYFKLLEAINGRAQEMLIRAENAKKGIAVNIPPTPEAPNWSDHILNRDKVREFNEYQTNKELGLE